MSEPRCVNIVQVGDKVMVTIRYPDTDEHYGHDVVYEGSMQDVMLDEEYEAERYASRECIQEYDWEMKMTKVCGCVECWPESQNVEGASE